jgi:glycosyltransferase involved in cell wall biosynthesis
MKPDDGIIKSNFVADLGYSPIEERSDFYVFVGRLNEQKGVKLLINIFIKNKKNLEIIGSGPLEDFVKEAAENNPNIHYLGYRNNAFIIEKLKKSRGLVVPSLTYEGQPMTILEAFSTGTPVYATNTKNLDTIVSDGENGFLFEPNNPDIVFGNLDTLHEKKVYINARKTYEEKYSPKSNCEQLMHVYKSVVPQEIHLLQEL